MTKEQMINAIESTKKIHLDQMHTISVALKGSKIDSPPPLFKNECPCGLWFNQNAQQLKDILGAQLFEKLDLHHEQWHSEYKKIYDILFKNMKKTGFLSKVLKKDKIDEMALDRAKAYYKELEMSTEAMLRVADAATRRILALSDSKFD